MIEINNLGNQIDLLVADNKCLKELANGLLLYINQSEGSLTYEQRTQLSDYLFSLKEITEKLGVEY